MLYLSLLFLFLKRRSLPSRPCLFEVELVLIERLMLPNIARTTLKRHRAQILQIHEEETQLLLSDAQEHLYQTLSMNGLNRTKRFHEKEM